MSDSLKAALWTAAFTFVSTLSVTLLGWLGDIATWAGTDGADFPSVSPLGKAAVAAFVAAAAGLFNWGFRWLQTRGTLPGNGPTYGELPPPPPPA